MSKHYRNPIVKPETVTVNKWEYDALVSNATIMTILENLIEAKKPYVALDVLEVMYKDIETGDD